MASTRACPGPARRPQRKRRLPRQRSRTQGSGPSTAPGTSTGATSRSPAALRALPHEDRLFRAAATRPPPFSLPGSEDARDEPEVVHEPRELGMPRVGVALAQDRARMDRRRDALREVGLDPLAALL